MKTNVKNFANGYGIRTFLVALLIGLGWEAHAQYEVVLVKERVVLGGKVVNVGQKLQQSELDQLKFEGNAAMIALYSPSQGRITRPETNELVASAAGAGSTKRNAQLDELAGRLKDYFRSYVIFTENPQLKFNTAVLNKDTDEEKYKTQYSQAVLYTRYSDPNTGQVNGKNLVELQNLASERVNETVVLSKTNLYNQAPAGEYIKTDVYVKVKGETVLDSSLVKTVYLTYLNNTRENELKKEILTIKRANEAQGKTEVDIFNMVYKYVDKYYGTPLPSDLGTWLNQNFQMTLNAEALTAPAN